MNIRVNLGDMPWQPSKNAQMPLKGKITVNGKSINLQNQDKQEKTQSSSEEKEGTISESANNQSAVTQNIEMTNEDKRKQILEDSLKQLQEKFFGEDTEERYQAVLKKAEDGEDLSEKDMAYLKSKNPKLYYQIKSEEMVQKTFEERLKHCKSKEEAQDAYIMTLDSAAHMSGIKGDAGIKPDKAKYKRLVKRINKVWEKYKNKKLDKKEEPKDVETKQEDALRRQMVATFEQFQTIGSTESVYDEQG